MACARALALAASSHASAAALASANLVVMRDPEGRDLPNRGVYLEVVENERLVFTDAYTRAWEPSAKPFMTVILTFEDEGGLGLPLSESALLAEVHRVGHVLELRYAGEFAVLVAHVPPQLEAKLTLYLDHSSDPA